MTMHRVLHPQTDVHRIYTSRNNGRRGMISVEYWVEMETEGLKKYVGNSNERLLKAVDSERILGDGKMKKEILTKRKKNFMEKVITLMVYNENRWSEEPGNLEQTKDRIVEKWNRECKWLHKTKHWEQTA